MWKKKPEVLLEGKVFDVVSKGGVSWVTKNIDDKKNPTLAKKNMLVEASWLNQNKKKIVIQFLVANKGNSFQLHGASIDDKFSNAVMVILKLKAAYKQAKK